MNQSDDDKPLMADTPITLELMVRHNISLLAPAESGRTWCAQVWLHANNFIVEHSDPERAVRACLVELEEQGLLGRAQITPGTRTGQWAQWP